MIMKALQPESGTGKRSRENRFKNISISKTMKKINKKVENKVSMYKVVLFLCEQNLTLMGLFVAINNLFILFKQKVNEIDSLIQQKLIITTGLSVDKKNLKKQLADLTERVAGAVHAYADSTGDNNLMHEVRYSIWDYLKMRDTVLVDVCRNIYTIANTNAANITGFGVDAVMLQTFSNSIDLFENKSPQPIEAREHSAMLTLVINEKEKEIDTFLKNRFDKAIKMLKASDPNFVMEFSNARQVIDLGIRHTKLKAETIEEMANLTGNITDADGNPIEDAVIELSNEAGVMSAEPDEDGDYAHEAIPRGRYKVKVISYGYITKEEEMDFETNDEREKDFVMEKDPSIDFG